MIAFFTENLATILISAGLLAVVIWISAGMIKKKKNGQPVGCSCGCEGCPSATMCHKH